MDLIKLCTEWLWILTIYVFSFFSVILSEWKSHQRNPHCLTHPRCVPNSSDLYISQYSWAAHYSLFPVTLSLAPSLCCRILHLQMKLPPSAHRTTTPQTRRSWPPPPATSGPPCTTWTQIWPLTSKTSLSHATLLPLLMRTVFLTRLQVRILLDSSSCHLYSKKCWPRSKHTADRRCSKDIQSLCLEKPSATIPFTLHSSGIVIDFCCGSEISLLAQFSSALWPPKESFSQRLCGSTHLGQRWNNEQTASASDISPELYTGWNVSPFLLLPLKLSFFFLWQYKTMKSSTWRSLAQRRLWVLWCYLENSSNVCCFLY